MIRELGRALSATAAAAWAWILRVDPRVRRLEREIERDFAAAVESAEAVQAADDFVRLICVAVEAGAIPGDLADRVLELVTLNEADAAGALLERELEAGQRRELAELAERGGVH